MASGKNPPERRPSGNVSDKIGLTVKFVAADVIMPTARALNTVAPLPGLDAALSIVDKIFSVMEQMRYNKKQSRRLAESARDTVDAIDDALSAAEPNSLGLSLTANINKLVK